MTKKSKNQRGFTIVELMVSAAVIIIIFSFVLANFRAGQYSGELDVILKQIVSEVSVARTKSLGGELFINESFPAGVLPENGYGIHFDCNTNPDQYYLFAAFTDSNEQLPGGVSRFKNIEFISFWGLTADGLDADGVLKPPGQGGSWQDIGASLEVVFPFAGGISIGPTAGEFEYVGGIIEHKKTGQKAYFYISLVSGMVGGDLL